MKGVGGLGEKFGRYYDKGLAVLAFTALVAALILAGIKMATFERLDRSYYRKLKEVPIRHPLAQKVDTTIYSSARENLLNPQQLGSATNAVFRPNQRVWCVECRLPISFQAETCPFCKTEQPTKRPPPEDVDKDGIRDSWEVKYGMDPKNPDDTELDPDGDGFTNLEEYLAKDLGPDSVSTDPTDKNDYPPIGPKLCVASLELTPFELLFKSVNKLPGGKYSYQVNTRRGSRSYFLKMGEFVEGYQIVKFKPNFKEVDAGGFTKKINISVLTLKKGRELIPLVLGEANSYTEQLWTVRFSVDQSEYTFRTRGDTITIAGRVYVVLKVDTRTKEIVIRPAKTAEGKSGIEMKISPCR